MRDANEHGAVGSSDESNCEKKVLYALCLMHYVLCLVRVQVIRDANEHGAAVLAVPMKATVKESADGMFVLQTIDRSRLWEIHTPQVCVCARLCVCVCVCVCVDYRPLSPLGDAHSTSPAFIACNRCWCNRSAMYVTAV
jgi:hypothetical protein